MINENGDEDFSSLAKSASKNSHALSNDESVEGDETFNKDLAKRLKGSPTHEEKVGKKRRGSSIAIHAPGRNENFIVSEPSDFDDDVLSEFTNT